MVLYCVIEFQQQQKLHNKCSEERGAMRTRQNKETYIAPRPVELNNKVYGFILDMVNMDKDTDRGTKTFLISHLMRILQIYYLLNDV